MQRDLPHRSRFLVSSVRSMPSIRLLKHCTIAACFSAGSELIISSRSFAKYCNSNADQWPHTLFTHTACKPSSRAGSILSVESNQNVESNIAFLLQEIRKFIKMVVTVSDFKAKMHRNPICAGALPQTMHWVLWRCWLGGRKGIRPVKNRVVGCWHGYLSRARCRLAYGPAESTATNCLLLQ